MFTPKMKVMSAKHWYMMRKQDNLNFKNNKTECLLMSIHVYYIRNSNLTKEKK